MKKLISTFTRFKRSQRGAMHWAVAIAIIVAVLVGFMLPVANELGVATSIDKAIQFLEGEGYHVFGAGTSVEVDDLTVNNDADVGNDVNVTGDVVIGSRTLSDSGSRLTIDGYNISRTATLVVAANDASAASKSQADYVCDGTADDVEIQAAIDACETLGYGTVQLTEGYYSTNDTIYIDHDLIGLIGFGNCSYIKLDDGVNKDVLQIGSSGNDRWWNRLEHLTIDGNKANQTTAGRGLYILDAGYLYVNDILVASTYAEGIERAESGAGGVFLSNIIVRGAGADGIKATTSSPNGIRGENIAISFCTSYGLHLANIEECQFTNLNVTNNSSDGLYCDAVGVSIQNFISQDNAGYGAYITGGHVDLDGGHIRRNTKQGIYTIYEWDLQVQNLWFDANCSTDQAPNPNTNIWIKGSSYGLIFTHNVFFDDAKTDYHIYDDSTGSHTFYPNSYENTNDLVYIANGRTPKGEIQVYSTALDLSGAATDVFIYEASVAGYLIGYETIYTEDSSADAGVAVRIGKQGDDDYFDSITSLTSQSQFDKTTYCSNALSQQVIVAGDTITVGTAGGKTGTGEVVIKLHIIEAR